MAHSKSISYMWRQNMREYVEKQLHTRVNCEPNDASEITTQNSFRKCR